MKASSSLKTLFHNALQSAGRASLLYLAMKKMMFCHHGIFFEDDFGLIGEFGFAKSVDAQIFFAVDEFVLLGQMGGKFLVNDGIGAFEVGVGFFDTDVKNIFADGCSVGVGHQLSAHIDDAAGSAEGFPIVENAVDGFALCVNIVFVIFILLFLHPLFVQLQACGEVVRRERAIDVVGKMVAETVDKIAFGLQLLAGEMRERFAFVDIVAIVSVVF